jgi:hypothetical protein
MTKRIKRQPVKTEARREWLRRYEENGESPPQIAAADRYDVRTVRSQIELAKQEREAREARSLVLRNALERHYDDLRRFAEKINSDIIGLSEVSYSPDDDLIEAALRQHLPRSPIWGLIPKRQDLRQKAEAQQRTLETVIEEAVRAQPKLSPLISAGLEGIVPGILAVLVAESKQWAQGNIQYNLEDKPVLEPAGQGLVNSRIGAFHMGIMPEKRAKEYMDTVVQVMDDLEIGLREHGVYLDLEKTIGELKRVDNKLREELAVIRLRRIVPGRCKYCPL